jgi:signal transduction histidine kinase
MAAGLAHEIRNPLGAIRGAAQFLADDIPEEGDREFLDIIVQEVDRLNKVVTEFLDYSRPLKTRLEPRDLNRIVQQVATMMETQGLPDGVNVRLELDPELPSAPIDVEKIKQVLLNLLQNAVQAMPAGGTVTLQTRHAPRVAWTGARRGEATLERVEIRVIDTGQGIAPDHLEKLFIPFFTTKSGGTGLGLAISQRLVQAHEGELEVRSTPGQGTRFTIRLPVIEPTPQLTAEERLMV